MSEFTERLVAKVQSFLFLSWAQARQLEAHYKLLSHWNARIPLECSGLADAVERCYAESLFLASQLPRNVRDIATFGTGGGFPGIPMAVALPNVMVTLVEPHPQKAVFLREATKDIANVIALSESVEDVYGNFDVIVSLDVDVLRNEANHLGRHLMLLGKPEQASALSGVIWKDPIPLPWDNTRSVLIGDVPRETRLRVSQTT